jgi:hypothetical protein
VKRAPGIAALAALWLLAAPISVAGTDPAAPEASPEAVAPGPDGWFDARSIHGGFSVRMPARFNDIRRSGGQKDGEPVNVNALEAVVLAAFGTVQTWEAVCIDHLERVPTAEAAFADATDEHETNGFLRWRRRSSFAGHPALDFAVSDGKRSIRSRVIVIGKRVCTAAVNFPVLDPVADADAEKFLASFKPR